MNTGSLAFLLNSKEQKRLGVAAQTYSLQSQHSGG
jgi:hypothetical protein